VAPNEYRFEDFDAAAWCAQLIDQLTGLPAERREAFKRLPLRDQVAGIAFMAGVGGDHTIALQANAWLLEDTAQRERALRTGQYTGKGQR
jgi:hypothetical protein